ncbi:MAG: hypothetical protein ACLPID_06470 [Beijerinckiaceae bacterium]
MKEWKRKNIENYLLVPDAWKRAVAQKSGALGIDLFTARHQNVIDRFFNQENLTLPPGSVWRDVRANIFRVVDGKRILFENDDSLFQMLKAETPSVELPRDSVAASMLVDEIHEDIHQFLGSLSALVAETAA